MERIEPTHKEIMAELDCCYYSRWHKGICECKSPNQFKSCYIEQEQKTNAKAMLDIERALAIFHGEIEE